MATQRTTQTLVKAGGPAAGRGKQAISLKEHVYQQIVEKICAGELMPDMIFTERQMIEAFGVSKAPVREALVKLCSENVLRCIPRCGYQVIQISAKTIHDITDLRILLEVQSLPVVLEKLTPACLEKFKGMNEARLKEADKRDLWTAWHNNNTFHLQLNGVAGNEQLTQTLERVLATCTRAYAQVFKDQKQVVAPAKEIFHDKIINSLERGELEQAQGFLREDLLLMGKVLLNT